MNLGAFTLEGSQKLVEIVGRLAPREGENLTLIPTIKLYRHEESFRRRPYMYGPCICVVVQGRKRMYYGGAGNQDKYNDYNPDNYLINSLSLPIESDAYDLSPERPFLAIQFDIDQDLAGKLVAQMDLGSGKFEEEDTTGIVGQHNKKQDITTPAADKLDVSLSTPVTARMSEIVMRLIETLEDPLDRRVLSPAITHELYYEVLRGPKGQLLRNVVANDAAAHKIAPVIHYIEENFEVAIEIEDLVKVAGMSPASLHAKFKEATTMTPIQFLKNFRLHKARRLILGGLGAGDAAFAVGYNSPSQFSREFKRLFNHSPREVSLQ